ncbi:MAG: response regulator receiver protein [Labilithrix sp.]|nr:response regulator receiver protein [Labilithrix sp.]
MAKTLLAVDDSVTMRKVLEITFSGEDFRVITAENAQSALGKLGENPGVFIVDTVLGGDDGYALAKELRKRSPGAPIIMLASRYAPYDQARGRDAGADDFADKPFDTQQLIDKIRKVILAKEAGGGQAAAPPPPAPHVGGAPAAAAGGAPYRAPSPPMAAPQAPAMAAAAPAFQGGNVGGSGGVGRGTQPSLAGAAQGVRTGTLVFGEQQNAPPAASPGPMPPRPAPAAPHAHAAPAPAPSPMATTHGTGGGSIGAAVNGQLAGKLGELGLSPAQADAVLALSRDVVERVVWEVVPQLAETMIKEEIARLMKD